MNVFVKYKVLEKVIYVAIAYPKCLGSEMFQISEFFRYWNICMTLLS
jgi:hypothetical protein